MDTPVINVAQLLNQITIPGLVAYLIEEAKVSKAPWLSWITTKTPLVNRIVATVTAALTSLGIHMSYSGGTLTFTGLSFTVIAMGVWNIAQSYLLQHGWYKAAFKSEVSDEPIVPVKAPATK